ncbi:MAG: hypothetical protein CMM10_18010, partial [Rhodospirillaceae bacterium]|nr:hypothetical protein [Rhodospirillaceae bacterium]
DGRFSTALFERYQRSEKALMSALTEMYVQGVSTRKVKKITEELCGHRFSASTISTIVKCLDGQLLVLCGWHDGAARSSPETLQRRRRGANWVMQTTSPFLRTLLVLGGVSILGPLGMDFSLPAFGAMQVGLKADAGVIKMTLGAVTAGMAAGQVFFGALADRFGRRPILNLGLAFFTFAALAVSLMNTAGPVIALRFLQGLGTSAVMIGSRAVVRDQFDIATSARLYAYLLVILGLVPVVGPVLSGWLTELYGWRSIFIVMAASSGAGWLVIVFFLRETLAEPDLGALNAAGLVQGFRQIIGDRIFAVHLTACAGIFIILFAVIGGIAPVMMGYLGESPGVFGYQYAAVMLANLIGAALTAPGLRVFGMGRLIALSVVVMGIGCGVFAAFVALGKVTAASVLAPTFVAMIGFGLVNPVLLAAALTNFKHMAGRAGALYGLISLAVGAATLFILGAVDDGTPVPMAVALAFGGVWVVVTYTALIHPLRPQLERIS